MRRRLLPSPRAGRSSTNRARAFSARLGPSRAETSRSRAAFRCRLVAKKSRLRRVGFLARSRGGVAEMKVLVAEDDPRSSEFLRKGLAEEGHSVECVADGRDA